MSSCPSKVSSSSLIFGAGVPKPVLTDEEIKLVRDGSNGVRGILPARFYTDPDIWKWEVENVLKKNWLFVGPWDWAEKPGDYFTIEMFGEPLVITRDKEGELHCLVNSCRHRWAKVAQEEKGNASVLVCPYHRWSYNLDGSLRAMSLESIQGLDKKDCGLPQLRLELWNGLIFINFDKDAKPLAPQLAEADKYIKNYGLSKFKFADKMPYESDWNYKFSFETGFEAYHHIGVHNERISEAMPPAAHRVIASGELFTLYGQTGTQEMHEAGVYHPFGTPPWMDEQRAADRSYDAMYLGVYPSLICFIQPHQISFITTQHKSVDRNQSASCISIADWAHEVPNAQTLIANEVQFMKDVQDEDTLACTSLQAGVRSSFNKQGYLHPKFEGWLHHYYEWWVNQIQKEE
ncbi:aromatic ring-hydroxylating dioxygenase subunit alpha [Pseudomonas sp. Z1-14]|uniref:aromatic ring-hydroxylating oxygenase subunit alpha n=1 Tax=Pseudomonas sp. Z1-14 TaxID=2817409 RepID=UPI003DA9C231